MQSVVDHHPEVVRYQMDNESLKAEIRRLRSEAKNGQLDQQKVEELEKMFIELQAESRLHRKDVNHLVHIFIIFQLFLKSALHFLHFWIIFGCIHWRKSQLMLMSR